MSASFDVLVIGSGPAGTSACWPLVEAGLRVGLIDPGGAASAEVEVDQPYPAYRRTGRDQWRLFLGDDLHALRQPPDASPKLRASTHRALLAGYSEAQRIETTDFSAFGSLAPGGLSNAWGAGVAFYEPCDLEAFPIGRPALVEPGRSVAARIGISGSLDDPLAGSLGAEMPVQPPLPLGAPAERLLAGFERAGIDAEEFCLGHGRNAVLSLDQADREACSQTALCLWGCPRRAIYNAARDVEQLAKQRAVCHLSGLLVESLRPDQVGCTVHARRTGSGQRVRLAARRVVLAAGAIGSGRLVLEALGLRDTPTRLLSSPAAAFALLLPKLIGQPTADRGFGLAQLAFMLEGAGSSGGDRVFGSLFATTGLPISDFIVRAPFSFGGARALFRVLMPAMLVGNAFFPGSVTDHRMHLTRDGRLVIRGRLQASFPAEARAVRRRLGHYVWRCGGWLIPGSFSFAALGSDMHYAGTVPMRSEPRPGESDADGRVAGLRHVYVVDAGAFPTLPAKPPTLMVMANATRVARGLAGALSSSAEPRAGSGREAAS